MLRLSFKLGVSVFFFINVIAWHTQARRHDTQPNGIGIMTLRAMIFGSVTLIIMAFNKTK
jgi:hypothetical protein